MKLTDKQSGNFIMFCVVCCFAINIPISKYILSTHSISPYGLTIARMLFATITFWIISSFQKKETISRKDHFTLLLGGLLGITFNQGLFIYGLSNTSPVDASIITTSTPLFALLIAAWILKEPITLQKFGGVIIGGLGAIYLVYSTHQTDINNDTSNLKGNICIMCSSLSYASYLVVTRPLSNKYSSVTLMKWMFLYSTIILLPLFYKNLINAPIFKSNDITAYTFFGYVLLFATVIPYMLLPKAQARIRATTISMYNNLQPLIASFIAILLGQDHFSLSKAVSGILILSGVYLVTQSKSKADLEVNSDKLNIK